IGKTYSPISGSLVKKHSTADVLNLIKSFKEGEKLLLLAPIVLEEDRSMTDKLKVLQQQGYARVQYKNEVLRIEEALEKNLIEDLFLVVDRIVIKHEEDFYNRLADAIETAFFEGKGMTIIESLSDHKHT